MLDTRSVGRDRPDEHTEDRGNEWIKVRQEGKMNRRLQGYPRDTLLLEGQICDSDGVPDRRVLTLCFVASCQCHELVAGGLQNRVKGLTASEPARTPLSHHTFHLGRKGKVERGRLP